MFSSASDVEQSELEVVRGTGISSRYALTGHVIYRGMASTIFLALERGSFLQVGVKLIMKKRLDPDEFSMALAEVDIQTSLPPHPNVVQVMASEFSTDAIVIVTPYTPHGDLWSLIQYGHTYCEIETRNCAGQVLDALRHVHGHGIVHGDVKPQNFLLYCVDGRFSVQLCDFGLAERMDPATGVIQHHGTRGTSGWFAPEMVEHREYGGVMDLFPCGRIFFRMLGGYPPFDPPCCFTDFVDFDEACWCHVSAAAKDFVQKLLTLEPSHRGTAASALEHTWLNGPPPPQPTDEQIASLSAFGSPPRTDVLFWPRCSPPDPQRCASYGSLAAMGDNDEMSS